MSNPIISSFCRFGECVQVTRLSDGSVALKSTLWPDTLIFTADEWAQFLAGVRAGEFDLDKL